MNEDCRKCIHKNVCLDWWKTDNGWGDGTIETMDNAWSMNCEFFEPEIIKCSQCSHFKPYDKPVEDFDGKCELGVGSTGKVDEDFFCGYSEWKGGEQAGK